jgi:hypothetical protein
MTSKKPHNFNQISICSNLSKTLSCTQAHFVDPDASKSPLKADTTLYLVPVFCEKLRSIQTSHAKIHGLAKDELLANMNHNFEINFRCAL